MRQSTFVRLLNEYIDEEISPRGLIKLKREIHRNPARCELYKSYCALNTALANVCDESYGFDANGQRLESKPFLFSSITIGALTTAAIIAFVIIVGTNKTDNVDNSPQFAKIQTTPAQDFQMASFNTGPLSKSWERAVENLKLQERNEASVLDEAKVPVLRFSKPITELKQPYRLLPADAKVGLDVR